MKLIITILTLISFSAQAYDCKATQVTKTEKADLEKMGQQEVFEGLLFELTSPTLPKSPAKAIALSDHLIEKENVEYQNSMIKLMVYAADLKKKTPRSLELKEVCEIVEKVNALPPKKK